MLTHRQATALTGMVETRAIGPTIHTEQRGGASPTWFLYSVLVRNRLDLFYVFLTRLSRSPLCAGHTNMLFQGTHRAMARRSVDQHRKEPDPDDLLAVFAASLKAARLEQGLTQEELAERAGLLQQYVSRIEQGKQNVTLTTAQAWPGFCAEM